ncbi:MAG: LysM peptidoglycan-binding domain-containing protein [Planctomycetota bacterium]|nr:MAG: LysM peptidoglycan-binding domain-containing protein [Planctomycetota bacterium]
MARRRSKRKASFGRRRQRRRSGPSPRLVLAGLCGLGGVGWFVGLPGSVGEGTPPALSTGAVAADEGTETAPPAGVRPAEDPGARPARPVPAELARALESEAGDADGLLDLRRLAVEFPGTPEAARARALLERVRTAGLAEADAEQGGAGGHLHRLRGLTRAYLATVDPRARRGLRERALAASREAFAPRNPPAALFKTVTVAPGDVLARIARREGSDYRLIMRLSGLRSDRIRVGQRLLVPRVPVSVIVFKGDFELVLLLGGHFLRAYDVATGKDGRTPEGIFEIGKGKLVNPDWYSPDGKLYKFGTKENILGTRWLPFVNTPEHQGFGIHGTSFPESIGTEASMGCLRLRNPDVEELYDLVPPGSRVRIVR